MQNRNVFILKSFVLILIVFYFPGLALYPFFEAEFQQYYHYQGSPYAAFLLAFFVYFFFFSMVYYFLDKLPYVRVRRLPARWGMLVVAALVVLYFVCCLYFYVNYDAGFRHTNRLANTGLLVKGMFVVQPMVYIYILFCIVHVVNGFSIGKINRKLLLVLLVSQVLSLNSSLQVFSMVFLVLLLFKPELYWRKLRGVNIYYTLGAVLLLPLVLGGVIIMGVGNKVGFGFLFTEEGLAYLVGSIGLIVARVSSSLFSLATLFDCCIFDPTPSFNAFQGFINTVMNRLGLILPGLNFETGLINTVNRSNFLTVFQGYIARAGASPGPLASMFYMPIFPFGVIMLPLLHVCIAKTISYHVENGVRYNVLSMVAIPYFILPFFEAPLNIFYIIDPVFIAFLFLFLCRFFLSKKVFLL
mgnify:CR=1 FL=1